MASALILATLSVIVVIILYYLLKTNKRHWDRFGVFAPKADILFGNYKDVILRRVTSFQFQEGIYNSYPNEKVVGLYRLTTPVLLLRDLDIIQYVFIREFDSFVNRGMEFGDELNANLGGSCDDTWRMLRSRLNPIFSFHKLKNMMYLMERCGDKMLEHLDATVSPSSECDVLKITKDYSVASISACVFGIDMDMENPDKNLTRIDEMIFTLYHVYELFYLCPGLLKKLGLNVLPNVVMDYFRKLVDFINKQRNGVPSDRKDFMDIMLEMKKMTEGGQKDDNADSNMVPITDNLIAAQAMIFYAAGFESGAAIQSFLLHELAKHQDIQEKLFQEIQQVLKDNNGELSVDTMKQMTFMSQVYDETLRMYPLLDLQRRVSAASVQIPGTDITLKRGDYVYVANRGIHYDEKYYPEPHKFDPDRFSPENVKSRHPCAYMPYGLGPRHCVGMRFANLQNRIFLAKFLTHYKVEPAAATKEFTYDPMKVTLAPKDGVPLKIIRRNK